MDQLQLVPLRIPSGWAVKFNTFWDIEPIIKDNSYFMNSEDFSEDLLSIERIVPDDLDWPRFIIDLGWYPPEDINGIYRLQLAMNSFDNILKIHEARDITQIRETIERWLLVLSEHFQDASGIKML